MDQKFIQLYDEYTHSTMSRRTFMDRLSALAGSAGAAALLPALENNYAYAETVPASDIRLDAGYVDYAGAMNKTLRAYFAKPKGGTKLPAVLVIHENRGLNPHIMDVTRRLALEGFLALALDALSPVGGTPEDMDKASQMIAALDMQETLAHYLATSVYLKNRPDSSGNVGCVGFCWGGSMANQLAVNAPDVRAAVAYYGGQPKAEDVPKIRASLMLHYAALDARINAGIPAYEAALKAAGKDYQLFMYEGVNHAFNNDTNAARYDAAAAALAWTRTIAFLKNKLALA
ncbi:MAG: carboxymethylenebutenolidase [Proteobacteria bacterium]|nr:carboxymethylenebutenolidase [Pseudomonadota bacterium]